jgi:hypothetical protein
VANFNFYNVTYEKAEESNQIVVRGEIENGSERNYNAVALRILLFIKSVPVANTVLVVNGLGGGRTKSFEKYIEDLDYNKVAKEITRYDIYVESAY